MKFTELQNNIMGSIKNIILKNKEIYDDGVVDTSKYDLELMKKDTKWNSFDIQSNQKFDEVFKTVQDMKESLSAYQVATFEEPSLEVESNEWAGFYYSISTYEPIDNFDELQEWQQKQIMKNYIAKEIGVHDYRYLRCEVLNLYKEDIITLEQLKEAHNKSC